MSCINISFCQGEKPVIHQIQFLGIQKMKTSFLNNNIATRTKDELTLKIVQNDVQFLKNIPGIKNAYYSLDTIDNKIFLNYNIEEIHTLLPILNFGGIKGNLWFTFGISDNNWRGLGQTFLAYYQNNNGRHSGKLFFKTPQMNGKKLGFSLSLNKWSSEEPLFFDEGTVQYIYDNNGVAGSIIYAIDRNRSIELGGNFFNEKYFQSTNQELSDPPGPKSFSQNKFLSSFQYYENFLKYNFFYLKGFEWFIRYQNVYNAVDKTKFNSIKFQVKNFIQATHTTNIASRISFAVSTNNNSPFAPFVVDSHVNLRGVGNRIDRGTAQAIINLEIRQTIYHQKNWASQFIIFSDWGSWRNPGGQLSDVFDRSEFRHFVGGGFRVIYQNVFGAVLRIDYGIDIYNSNQRGLVLGLGQYF